MKDLQIEIGQRWQHIKSRMRTFVALVTFVTLVTLIALVTLVAVVLATLALVACKAVIRVSCKDKPSDGCSSVLAWPC